MAPFGSLGTKGFEGFQYGGNATVTRRHHPGNDNSAPVEDVHNKNPSLVALGKSMFFEILTVFMLDPTD